MQSRALGSNCLDVIQAGCFAVLQYSDTDVEFRCSKWSRESRVVRVSLSIETYFRLSVRYSSGRSWCATWFAMVLQCCFGLNGSSKSLRIVDHAFLLLWVRSIDSNCSVMCFLLPLPLGQSLCLPVHPGP